MFNDKIRAAAFAVLASVAFAACGDGSKRPASTTGPLRPADLTPVTNDYGQSIVQYGEFEAMSNNKPWSSWWFPTRDKYLFEGTDGGQSPLEKYDTFAKKNFNKNTKAASYERENVYDPNAIGWEGLCHAWALASLMEPEPSRSTNVGGVVFGVGDLKALLIKSYERAPTGKQYGQRNNGDRYAIYDDLHPDQLHRFIQAELFEKGRPFIMDRDPSLPVWNTPVWAAQLRIEKDPNDPAVAHVTTWLRGASPFVNSYDYVGTLSVQFQYTYDLIGVPREDGGLDVLWGVWTGDSLDYHPDFVTVMPESTTRSSVNPEVDIAIIDAILGKTRP